MKKLNDNNSFNSAFGRRFCLFEVDDSANSLEKRLIWARWGDLQEKLTSLTRFFSKIDDKIEERSSLCKGRWE